MAAELTGVLLAGGASRRFGSPKALAPFGGETLAERAWRLLGEVCSERLAVGKPGELRGLPFPLLEDASAVRAPLAGLVAGLRAAKHEIVVALPVDCPLVGAEDLLALAAACADAAVPQTGPLPGAFRKTALAVLERALADGRLAIRAALEELETTVVVLDEHRLANANTREELEALNEAFGS
jgi:molybdopterin-guanine dinucleotide biosynthesis protein A